MILLATAVAELRTAAETVIADAKKTITVLSHQLWQQSDCEVRSNKPQYYMKAAEAFENAFIEMRKPCTTAAEYDALNAQRWAILNDAERKLKADIEALKQSYINNNDEITNLKAKIKEEAGTMLDADMLNIAIRNALAPRAIHHVPHILHVDVIVKYGTPAKSAFDMTDAEKANYLFLSNHCRLRATTFYIYVGTLNISSTIIEDNVDMVLKRLNRKGESYIINIESRQFRIDEQTKLKEYLTYTLINLEAVTEWQQLAADEKQPNWNYTVPANIYCGKKTVEREARVKQTQPWTWLNIAKAGIQKINGIEISKWIEARKVVWPYPKKVLTPLLNSIKYTFARLEWFPSNYSDGEGKGSYYKWLGEGCDVYSNVWQPCCNTKYTQAHMQSKDGTVPTVMFQPATPESDVDYMPITVQFFEHDAAKYDLYYRKGVNDVGDPATYLLGFVKHTKAQNTNGVSTDSLLNEGNVHFMSEELQKEARILRAWACLWDHQGGLKATDARSLDTSNPAALFTNLMNLNPIYFGEEDKVYKAIAALIEYGVITWDDVRNTGHCSIKHGYKYYQINSYAPDGSGEHKVFAAFHRNGSKKIFYNEIYIEVETYNYAALHYADEKADPDYYGTEKYVINKQKEKEEKENGGK